jgi:hypothetical protein
MHGHGAGSRRNLPVLSVRLTFGSFQKALRLGERITVRFKRLGPIACRFPKAQGFGVFPHASAGPSPSRSRTSRWRSRSVIFRGGSNNPNWPFSGMNGSFFGFEMTHPIGPSNHLLGLLVTQSSSWARPTIPPISNLSGSSTPLLRANSWISASFLLGGRLALA